MILMPNMIIKVNYKQAISVMSAIYTNLNHNNKNSVTVKKSKYAKL